jgi:hypothetical protein
MNLVFNSPELTLILAWLTLALVAAIGYYLVEGQKKSS